MSARLRKFCVYLFLIRVLLAIVTLHKLQYTAGGLGPGEGIKGQGHQNLKPQTPNPEPKPHRKHLGPILRSPFKGPLVSARKVVSSVVRLMYCNLLL